MNIQVLFFSLDKHRYKNWRFYLNFKCIHFSFSISVWTNPVRRFDILNFLRVLLDEPGGSERFKLIFCQIWTWAQPISARTGLKFGIFEGFGVWSSAFDLWSLIHPTLLSIYGMTKVCFVVCLWIFNGIQQYWLSTYATHIA